MNFVFDFSNIAAERGVAIALTGLFIVFFALSLISLFITLLPHVLKLLAPILPKPHEPKKRTPGSSGKGNTDLLVAAAAATAVHQHHQKSSQLITSSQSSTSEKSQ